MRTRWPRWSAVGGALLLGSLTVGLAGSCAGNQTAAPLRALQSAGPTAFLCLGAPDDPDRLRPLTDCDASRTATLDDFSIPHLYGFVTQPITGEVAVVDLTTEQDAVLDVDASVPGASFLPVGAQPTDIVSTPGGAAVFVSVAEPRFEGIYGLPADDTRDGAPRLTSWPVCALPAAPGEMLLLVDPADPATGAVRPRCDRAFGDDEQDPGCEGVDHCHGDLEEDAARAGHPGRYKLAVTLPDAGGVAIIDAQDILDQEAGAYEDCPIDRWVPFDVMSLPAPPAPPTADDAACVPEELATASDAAGFVPLPGGMSFDGERVLYVADRSAPVIHRLDLPTPCEPAEVTPLATRSDDDPSRVVTTRRVAVSPLTRELRRFLYAVDERDGSVLVYDVSDGSNDTEPVRRADPVLNPFQPADRIRFGAPPRDIVILELEANAVNDATGATLPLRCDPRPSADGTPAATYRTSDDLTTGARPRSLRGVFAFVVLASGDVVVIDVDDYDDACRGPTDQSVDEGCERDASGLATSGEYSCRAVSPHEPRSAVFLLTEEGLVDNEPGLNNFPLLFDPDGAVLQLDDVPEGTIPRMRATLDRFDPEVATSVVVGSARETISRAPDTGGLLIDGVEGLDRAQHTLVMNREDPRAHILTQGFTVTYEGPLPGFGGRFAALTDGEDGTYELLEPSSQFCRRGVRPEAVWLAIANAEGLSADEAAATAAARADYVQIVSSPPVEADPYWTGQSACTFNQCQQTFGTNDSPLTSRDFRITEATEERLSLEPRDDAAPATDVTCCFPGVIEFAVRSGNQWTVIGDQVGFLHRMTTDEEGRCRPSCDPDLARRTGRVLESPVDTAVRDGDGFRNPFFRFTINAITADGTTVSQRDMRFTFATRNAFAPLSLNVAEIANDGDVQPTAVRFLPATGDLVVSDGSLQGIILLNAASLTFTRQYN
ncbi:MAG: hypothetical protein AAGN82_18290 [Myxococcota bacterium]